jgi:inner membrane protein
MDFSIIPKEMSLDAWHVWFLIAIVLFIAEIFTPGFFLACLGIAAIVSGIVDLLGGSLVLQFLFYCITTLVVLVGMRPFFVRFFREYGESFPTNYKALIGKLGIVEEAIDRRTHDGRVKVGGESWRAVSHSAPVLPKGASVRVLAIDGNKLVVESLKDH